MATNLNVDVTGADYPLGGLSLECIDLLVEFTIYIGKQFLCNIYLILFKFSR